LSTPDGLPPLREVIRAAGLSAKKSLGQNFLLDLNLTRRIARAAGPLEGVTIVEIGPGPGGLTRALLLEGASRVVAIERDERCLPALSAIAALYPGRLDVIAADAREMDYRSLALPSPARIVAKVNALVDPPMIQALYRASQAGVEIDLIVRGQCALVPGLRAISSHIRVRSIVGRFLEHSRIFYFANAGEPEIFLGSADWMQRNLYERVEVLFPLKDPQLRRRITEQILPAYLADTRAARLLGADGTFRRSRCGRNGRGISVQEQLMRAAQHSPSAFDTRLGQNRRKIDGTVYTGSAGAAPDAPPPPPTPSRPHSNKNRRPPVPDAAMPYPAPPVAPARDCRRDR